MANDLYLVFSKRPDGISAADYDRWYDEHSQENIESPGFVHARRYAVDQVNGPEMPFEHLAVYEYTGGIERWRSDLDRRIREGDVVLPEWFPQIQFGSWSCSPVSDLLTPKTHPGT
jgi:hypothetical protein